MEEIEQGYTCHANWKQYAYKPKEFLNVSSCLTNRNFQGYRIQVYALKQIIKIISFLFGCAILPHKINSIFVYLTYKENLEMSSRNEKIPFLGFLVFNNNKKYTKRIGIMNRCLDKINTWKSNVNNYLQGGSLLLSMSVLRIFYFQLKPWRDLNFWIKSLGILFAQWS